MKWNANANSGRYVVQMPIANNNGNILYLHCRFYSSLLQIIASTDEVKRKFTAIISIPRWLEYLVMSFFMSTNYNVMFTVSIVSCDDAEISNLPTKKCQHGKVNMSACIFVNRHMGRQILQIQTAEWYSNRLNFYYLAFYWNVLHFFDSIYIKHA